MSADSYSAMLAEARQSVNYWQDIAQTDFAREVHHRMKDMGVGPAELARRMGTSKAYVSQLLDGGNFTLLTMVKIAMALGSVVRIHLESHEDRASRAAMEQDSKVVVDLPQRDARPSAVDEDYAARKVAGRK
jgi:transcriptional regulator with XRE-family HTH domain